MEASIKDQKKRENPIEIVGSNSVEKVGRERYYYFCLHKKTPLSLTPPTDSYLNGISLIILTLIYLPVSKIVVPPTS